MNQELSTNSILSLIDTDKATRQSFVTSHINLLKEGNTDILQSHIQAKNMEQMLKELLSNDEYKSMVLDTAQQYGAKSFERHNAKVEIKEAGTTWTYPEDTEYLSLLGQLEEIKGKIKAREKFLQNIPASGVADPVSGEMIYPAVKSSTTTVAITLK